MKKLWILSAFFSILLASVVLAVTSPIPNAGFETGDLTDWTAYCGGGSGCAGPWEIDVREEAAYEGDFGAYMLNSNKDQWSSVILRSDFFNDNSEVYKIALKRINECDGGGSAAWIRIFARIGSGTRYGHVSYGGNKKGNWWYGIPFVMGTTWKEYEFNFRQDFYNTYRAYPSDTRRFIQIIAYQDRNTGSPCEFYVDNVFGEPEAPCTDNDGDGYSIEGGSCGEIDCDDNDANINPGADDSICNGLDENCDGVADDGYVATQTTCGIGECFSTGEMICTDGIEVNTCVEGYPSPELCDTLDNDCNGIADDIDADGDGMNDCTVDLCLLSALDNIELNPNQYAYNDGDFDFERGPGNDDSIVYDITVTKGCTCTQIVEQLELGEGHLNKGCSPSAMEDWTGVSAEPDNEAGIGKNIPKSKVTGKVTEPLSETTWLGLVSLVSVLSLAAVCLTLLKNTLKK